MSNETLNTILGALRNAVEQGDIDYDGVLAALESPGSRATYADAVALARRSVPKSTGATYAPHWAR